MLVTTHRDLPKRDILIAEAGYRVRRGWAWIPNIIEQYDITADDWLRRLALEQFRHAAGRQHRCRRCVAAMIAPKNQGTFCRSALRRFSPPTIPARRLSLASAECGPTTAEDRPMPGIPSEAHRPASDMMSS